MQDLTKITTPFGLLDEETKAALKAHKGPIEGYDCFGVWHCTQLPAFNPGTVYRAKPQPVRGEVVFDGTLRTYYSLHAGTTANCYANKHDHCHVTFTTADEMLIPGTYTEPGGATIKIEVVK